MSDSGTPDGTPSAREPGHEVWVRLGKAAMDLHAALSDEPVSGREAGRRALPPVAKSTALRLLPVLAEYGLAKQSGDGWTKTPVTLDEIAGRHGWTGQQSRRLQRQQQFEIDRAMQELHYGLPGILANPSEHDQEAVTVAL
jgi:hypothetical protein